MKFIFAILSFFIALFSGLIIFICTVFLCGYLFTFICPECLFSTELYLVSVSLNIPCFIALVIATVAATLTFRASLRTDIFGLHTKNMGEKDKGTRDQSSSSGNQTNQALKS